MRVALHTRRGFTLIELLVTIGIILLLLSTVLAALRYANTRAQKANTEFLMSSIKNGLERFKADHGYYPPSLGVPSQLTSGGVGATLGWAANPLSTNLANVGAGSDLLVPPVNATGSGIGKFNWWNDVAERQGLQRWHSCTALPEYLLGWRDRSGDGYGSVMDGSSTMPGGREVPRLGIRSPGKDGVWGAAMTSIVPAEIAAAGLGGQYLSGAINANPNVVAGLSLGRNLAVPPRIQISSPSSNDIGNNNGACIPRCQPNLEGKVFGPYLDLKDDRIMGGIEGWDLVSNPEGTGSWWEPRIVSASQVTNFDALPKCLVDYWGRPIRYFRKGYVSLDPSLGDPASNGSQFDLGDFFALRPETIPKGADSDGIADFHNDATTTRALQAASFGLHSCGPDKKWNPMYRVDQAGTNADNIVELGP